MNHKTRNKDLLDQTIIRIKEKYPMLDTFLCYDYNTRCDIISNIVEIHEESMIEYSNKGIDLGLPFIGRLTIKKNRLIYDKLVDKYIEDNNINSKSDLTEENREELTDQMRKLMFINKLENKPIPTETRVFTFKRKVINKE